MTPKDNRPYQDTDKSIISSTPICQGYSIFECNSSKAIKQPIVIFNRDCIPYSSELTKAPSSNQNRSHYLRCVKCNLLPSLQIIIDIWYLINISFGNPSFKCCGSLHIIIILFIWDAFECAGFETKGGLRTFGILFILKQQCNFGCLFSV